MGDVVEHDICHMGKTIFGSVGGQEAAFRSCKVPGSHRTICALRFQSSNIGGKERARNLFSDALENDFLVANRATLRPFEGPRVLQHDLIFQKSA